MIVAFEGGLTDSAFIVGAVWNGKESLPQTAEAANNKRTLKTRSGTILEFDDTQATAKVTLSMKTGYKLVFEEQSQTVTLHHANGCELVMKMSGTVRLKANATVEVHATVLNVALLQTLASSGGMGSARGRLVMSGFKGRHFAGEIVL